MRRWHVPLAGLLVSGCGGVQSPLNPAADAADHLFSLFSLMLWVCGGAYLLVMIFLGMALWRHRAALSAPRPTSDDRLKIGLGAWTAFMVVGLGGLAGASFLVDHSLASRSGANAVQVRITGHQWWWRVQYRDPATGGWIETANEIHLPLQRPVRIELQSTDVIHSFWIPNLSGKIDMIPGRTNVVLATPRRTGWFRGQCAEFCGLQHAKMALDVKVEDAAGFATWLANEARPAGPPGETARMRGLQLISQGTCGQCHTVRGTPAQGRAGPDLTHVASRRALAAGTVPLTRGSLMGWIAQPQAIKPGVEMPPSGLSPPDALAVVSYLEALK